MIIAGLVFLLLAVLLALSVSYTAWAFAEERRKIRSGEYFSTKQPAAAGKRAREQ